MVLRTSNGYHQYDVSKLLGPGNKNLTYLSHSLVEVLVVRAGRALPRFYKRARSHSLRNLLPLPSPSLSPFSRAQRPPATAPPASLLASVTSRASCISAPVVT